jgi:hypothetical protein
MNFRVGHEHDLLNIYQRKKCFKQELQRILKDAIYAQNIIL